MFGFVAGLYVAGGIWYYKRSEPLTNAEKAIVATTWPGLLALELVFIGLDYAARKALRETKPVEKEKIDG